MMSLARDRPRNVEAELARRARHRQEMRGEEPVLGGDASRISGGAAWRHQADQAAKV